MFLLPRCTYLPVYSLTLTLTLTQTLTQTLTLTLTHTICFACCSLFGCDHTATSNWRSATRSANPKGKSIYSSCRNESLLIYTSWYGVRPCRKVVGMGNRSERNSEVGGWRCVSWVAEVRLKKCILVGDRAEWMLLLPELSCFSMHPQLRWNLVAVVTEHVGRRRKELADADS